MSVRLASALVATLALPAAPAAAHPHIFIDAGVELMFDDSGALAALRVLWAYDELFSLLVIEELGLDRDYDGQLTEDERAALAGFDMDWIDGFAGDLYAEAEGRALALSGPLDWTADYVEGRIVTTHLRAFEPRLAPGAAEIVLRVYDPTYYTAYRIASAPRFTGRADCSARILVPDHGAAARRLQAALAELLAAAGPEALEQDFPAVGAAFAEEIRVACAPPS